MISDGLFPTVALALMAGFATPGLTQSAAGTSDLSSQVVFDGEQPLGEETETLDLDRPASTRQGTFDIAFRLDRPITVKKTSEAGRILEILMPGFSQFHVGLTGEPLKSRRELVAIWQDHNGAGDLDMWHRWYFMHFQQDTIYHLTISWDGESGAFKCYLNGYLVKTNGSDAWDHDGSFGEVKIAGPDVTLLALRHWDGALDDEQVAEAVGQPSPAPVPEEIGQNFDDRKLDLPGDKTLIDENPLAEQSDVEDWAMEGPGDLEFEDGWMVMSSAGATEENATGHHTFWTDVDLPENYLVTWRFRPEHRGLAMMFLDAKGLDGEDVLDPSLDPRHGNFPEYWRGDIRSYHFSYFDSGEWVRVNKNPHKLLFAMGMRPKYEIGRTYELSVMKRGNRIIHAIDGNVVFEAEDREAWYGPVWRGGKLGLRQMAPCVAGYQDLRVYELQDNAD